MLSQKRKVKRKTSSLFSLERLDLFGNCYTLDFRKVSVGYTMIKLATQPSHVSSRKSYPGANINLFSSTGENRPMKLFGVLSPMAPKNSHLVVSRRINDNRL